MMGDGPQVASCGPRGLVLLSVTGFLRCILVVEGPYEPPWQVEGVLEPGWGGPVHATTVVLR